MLKERLENIRKDLNDTWQDLFVLAGDDEKLQTLAGYLCGIDADLMEVIDNV